MNQIRSLLEKVSDKVKPIGDRFISEVQKTIDLSAAQSVNIVLPWERKDFDPSVQKWLKQNILFLSKVHSNFLKRPESVPPQFKINVAELQPVTTRLFEVDPNLKGTFYFLVPEFVPEADFWQNYYIRIHLYIQQAKQKNAAIKIAQTLTDEEKAISKQMAEDLKQKSLRTQVPDQAFTISDEPLIDLTTKPEKPEKETLPAPQPEQEEEDELTLLLSQALMDAPEETSTSVPKQRKEAAGKSDDRDDDSDLDELERELMSALND
ncbi:hypothetical protein BLNAU_4702 [Blattamonas nauphoetae]|uniref:BSD domain-containing protein n=1 Tax=Blattamonas nauphoetae TaxID=2049346 RepID=A0ABQ9Y9X3_9EUKA|nr:hypothetical protein BLNAU_4702 [Blattamonas nauphoetae]